MVEPHEGDDGAAIQAALDEVATLPRDMNGFHGAVQLAAGEFQVAGSLLMNASGVVLRGAGAVEGGTTIVATGQDRRAVIRIQGQSSFLDGLQRRSARFPLTDEYIAAGSTSLRIANAKVDDHFLIASSINEQGVERLGAKALGVGWRGGSRTTYWMRKVVEVKNGIVQLDAPITFGIDKRYCDTHLYPYNEQDTTSKIGIEDLRIVSEYNSTNSHDEEHAWHAVVVNNVTDVWLRRLRCEHFAGGAVLLREGVRRATVEDVLALAPVSELGGYRRHTFFTQGQQCLFLRCYSEHGLHDFATGHCAAGPNAFVNCYAAEALGDSGPLESWSSGVLYDNVRIDGHELRLANRWLDPPGAGWSAANCLLWQCQAARIRCFQPPGAHNWVIGFWGQPIGDGEFHAESDFVTPISLFQQQLAERVSAAAANGVGPFLLNPEASTNPTVEEAAAFVERSKAPVRTLRDVIEERMAGATRTEIEPKLRRVVVSKPSAKSQAKKQLKLENGWLTIDGRVAVGATLDPIWWRGTIRPGEVESYGPSITRFAPGRIGTGMTDDLETVATQMQASNKTVYDHHYGLWYDRRRDDHLMVRRMDGAVAPPFFEQPFARTGRGHAWNGLSKYDLTEFNPWYWRRLADFSALCDEQGLVLIHQNYFQHNILEAGAHWADSPWRPANNINDTGLPEPPPYVGDKRIFMAPFFYDLSHPERRKLHEGYIRQCLVSFAERTNVIQSLSAEYTGPLHFTQFWLDTIAKSQVETGRDQLISIACTKDSQDAVLADAERAKLVDIIDIRYWCYDRDGKLYAPAGGVNLAPRQHLRQINPKPADPSSIHRTVREMKLAHPDKAVTYYAYQNCNSPNDGWAVLMGGGSLAAVPRLPEELLATLPKMKPADEQANLWRLAAADGSTLIYAPTKREDLKVTLPESPRGYRVVWINPDSGAQLDGGSVAGGEVKLAAEDRVIWLTRRD